MKVVKFIATRAALPAKAGLHAKAGAKPDGGGFQALLRKLTTSAAGATRTEAGTQPLRAVQTNDRENGERGDFEAHSTLRSTFGEREPAEPGLSHRLPTADLFPGDEEVAPRDLAPDPEPAVEEAEPGQASAPPSPSALSAFLFSPIALPAERIEPSPQDVTTSVVAPPARQAREAPEGDSAAPPADPTEIAAPPDVDIIARPVAAALRQTSVEPVDAGPESVPVVAAVVARETYFVPMRGREAPATARAPRAADRIDAPEPRQAQSAVPVVATPDGDADPDPADIDDAPRQETTRVGEPVQGVAAAAASPDPLPVGQPVSGLPPAVLQQLGTAVATGADALMAQASERPLAPPDAMAQVPSPGRADAMEVRLDLPEHGALHVRMTLAGNALSLRLRPDREETAHRLRYDRDELSTILTRAGYSVDILTIQSRPVDGAAPSPSAPAGGQQATTGEGATAHGQREQRQPQSQPQSQQPPGTSRQNPDDHPPRRDRASSGSLYV